MEWSQVRLDTATPRTGHDPVFEFDCPQFVDLRADGGSPQLEAFAVRPGGLPRPPVPSPATPTTPATPATPTTAGAGPARGGGSDDDSDDTAYWSVPRPFHEAHQTPILRARAKESAAARIVRTEGRARRGTPPQKRTIHTPASRVKSRAATARRASGRKSALDLMRERASNTPSRLVLSQARAAATESARKRGARRRPLASGGGKENDDDAAIRPRVLSFA